MSENPFLAKPANHWRSVPFDQIRPEHFLPALDHAMREARVKLDSIKSMPADFSTTIEELESLSESLDWVAGIFYNLLGAETNEELQALAAEVGPRLAAFSSDVILDAQLFAKVKSVYARKAELKLSTEQRQLLENTYLEFVRNGANLEPAKQERLREIDRRLSQLGPLFNQHVLKATNEFELYLEGPELDGLPESVVEAAKAAAEAKGRPGEALFTLQYPSITPFLKYSENRPAREQMALAFARRAFGGPHDNQPVVKEIIALRHERARLLGYQTHAHFVLERRMAGSPEQVREFLEKLLAVVKPAAEREVAMVEAFARSIGGPSRLETWDYSFYAEKLKEKQFSFSEEDLRPYFQLERVIDGVFQVAARLYDLEFTATESYPVYHPDVRVFEVRQKRGPATDYMGLLYADFFPRASKRDGAWMTSYFDQGRFLGEVRRPHVSIVCNFTKPTPSKPSLLTLSEVKTLFHEFGHALHSLLSRCEYRTLSGTNVFWDFVELPSQVLENWTTEKEALDLFARHYQTGEPMPTELIEKVHKSETFMAGYMALRQLNFAFLDLAWHTQDPATITDVGAFEDQTVERTQVLPRAPGTNSSCSFEHIFGGGYAAGYYSYKWAEVLDADAFEFFKENGIFNREIARRFEENILSRGGSEHPAALYRRFRGRDPDPQALLRRKGLL